MSEGLDIQTHCPANKAADLIGDKWVLQIVRSMMMGARRYSDLKQSIPKISPAVLSARLKALVEQGIIVKREIGGSNTPTYRLTASGRELRPIVEQLALWGLRWASRNVRERDIDIGALMWDIHQTLRTQELPDGETVISIALRDVDKFKSWWLVAEGRKVDLCSDNPGKEVDVYLSCDIADLTKVWRGEASARELVNAGQMSVDGPQDLVTSIDDWIPLSPMAGAPAQVEQDVSSDQ
ncbi:MAG: helix-turn-helix domain-containing protein [Erythrobacter sp.]